MIILKRQQTETRLDVWFNSMSILCTCILPVKHTVETNVD